MVVLRTKLKTQTFLFLGEDICQETQIVLGPTLDKGTTFTPKRVFKRGRHSYVVFTSDGIDYEVFGPHLEIV